MDMPPEHLSFSDFGQSLVQSKHEDELKTHFSAFLGSIGIFHFAATLYKFYRDSVYVTALLEQLPNLSMTVEQTYECKTRSSLSRLGHHTQVPFFWKLDIFHDDDPVDAFLKQYLVSEGLNGGFTVPIVHSFSTMTTLVIGLDDVSRYESKKALLYSAALHLMDSVKRIRFPISSAWDFAKNNKPSPPLSPRESEIISWIALGKSSWEVSKIISISEHTVNDHIESAIRKLSAKNRTEAVAIALLTHQVDLTKAYKTA